MSSFPVATLFILSLCIVSPRAFVSYHFPGATSNGAVFGNPNGGTNFGTPNVGGVSNPSVRGTTMFNGGLGGGVTNPRANDNPNNGGGVTNPSPNDNTNFGVDNNPNNGGDGVINPSLNDNTNSGVDDTPNNGGGVTNPRPNDNTNSGVDDDPNNGGSGDPNLGIGSNDSSNPGAFGSNATSNVGVNLGGGGSTPGALGGTPSNAYGGTPSGSFGGGVPSNGEITAVADGICKSVKYVSLCHNTFKLFKQTLNKKNINQIISFAISTTLKMATKDQKLFAVDKITSLFQTADYVKIYESIVSQLGMVLNQANRNHFNRGQVVGSLNHILSLVNKFDKGLSMSDIPALDIKGNMDKKFFMAKNVKMMRMIKTVIGLSKLLPM